MAKDALGHGSNARGGKRALAKPIPGHPFHTKSDAELRFIAKDAAEAGRNAQEMGDQRGVSKYADQVADAATVMGYRNRGGAQDLGSRAASELASGAKSATVPVHDSMSTDAFGRPRSAENRAEYDEYNRDLALRARNGQVGSGMKFRG